MGHGVCAGHDTLVGDSVAEEFADEDVDELAENGLLNLMVVLLKQFVAFISGTSSRAAKVMSTH